MENHTVITEGHSHHHHRHGGMDGFHDYTEAVNAYRKTFPNKQKVLEQTPEPTALERGMTPP